MQGNKTLLGEAKGIKFVKVRKLFNNNVSIRDYLVNEAIQEGGLIVELGNQRMILSKSELMRNGTRDPNVHRSKWDTKTYQLIDFKWNPDKAQMSLLPDHRRHKAD